MHFYLTNTINGVIINEVFLGFLRRIKMKKVLSVLLAAIMAFTVTSLGFNAFAADGESITVTVTGTQNNELIKEALDRLNDLRTTNGADKLDYDKELTKVARNCAIKMMLHFDDEYTLPNGDAITSLYPEFGNTAGCFASTLSELSVDAIVDGFGELNSLSTIKSIGAAAFTSGKTTVLFFAVSTIPSSEVETVFSSSIISVKEQVLVSNLLQGIIDFDHVKNGKYSLSMRVKGSGASDEYYSVLNSDIAYRSNNSKIFKIIGSNGYVKKNGTVTISSYAKSGSLLIQGQLPCTVTKNKPAITKLTAKKKALSVKWTKNITNASGYEIQYSTSKKFKKAKTVTVKGKKNISKTIKKLKSGKRYYVRVRAYVNQGEGEKLYTPWSAKKSIKVK